MGIGATPQLPKGIKLQLSELGDFYRQQREIEKVIAQKEAVANWSTWWERKSGTPSNFFEFVAQNSNRPLTEYPLNLDHQAMEEEILKAPHLYRAPTGTKVNLEVRLDVKNPHRKKSIAIIDALGVHEFGVYLWGCIAWGEGNRALYRDETTRASALEKRVRNINRENAGLCRAAEFLFYNFGIPSKRIHLYRVEKTDEEPKVIPVAHPPFIQDFKGVFQEPSN
jgi:hypothetical protein